MKRTPYGEYYARKVPGRTLLAFLLVIFLFFGMETGLFCTEGHLAAEEPSAAIETSTQKIREDIEQENKCSVGTLFLLDAVARMLESDPNILIQRERVAQNRGALQTAEGQFDVLLSTTSSYDVTWEPLTESQTLIYETDSFTTGYTSLETGLTKQFRLGTTMSMNVGLTRSDDLTEGSETLPVTYSTLSFSIVQPLLKDCGVKATGAAEKAARIEYEASLYDLNHTVSNRVLAAVKAYWSYYIAVQNLDILKASEERVLDMVRKIEKLIHADEIPRAELNQMQAYLESKSRARIAAEQTLVRARHSLGYTIGLNLDETIRLGPPSDSIDSINAAYPSSITRSELYIHMALANRGDYRASQLREMASEVFVKASKNGLRPRLDTTFSVGYNGLDEGEDVSTFFNSLGQNVYGNNYGGILSFSWYLGRNVDKGILLQNRARHEQTKITTKDLARAIAMDISISISTLGQIIEELASAENAYQLYQIALNNEKKKFTLGSASLLDVMTTEENLTYALIDKLSANLKLANAIARFRFETGTLFVIENSNYSLTLDNIMTIPKF